MVDQTQSPCKPRWTGTGALSDPVRLHPDSATESTGRRRNADCRRVVFPDRTASYPPSRSVGYSYNDGVDIRAFHARSLLHASCRTGAVRGAMIEYRIVVLGAAGVGKTALTVRLVNDRFVTRYIPTIEDRYRKEVVIDHESCVLRIVDTAGLKNYDFLWDAPIRTGDGFLVVFSLMDVSTFEDVHRFWERIKTLKDADVVPMVLVGNKCDAEEPAVDSCRARARAVCYNCSYVETSAATGHGVERAFFEVVRESALNSGGRGTTKVQRQGWEAARLTDQIDPVFVLNVSRSLNLSLTLTLTPEPKPCLNKTNPHSKTRPSPPPSPSPTPKPKH
ncbi:hypothetical protein STEG23_023363 [Scotinomys teguina]